MDVVKQLAEGWSSTSTNTETPTPRRTEGERKVLVTRLAAQLGERYSVEAVNLMAYRATTARQKAVLARCSELRDRLAELTVASRGLVWIGTIGTGKDHLMAAPLYAAAWRHGLSCCWTTAEELYAKLRDAMDQDRTESSVIRPYLESDILAVSDPLPNQGNPRRLAGPDVRAAHRPPLPPTAARVGHRQRGRPVGASRTAHAASGRPVAPRSVVLERFWPSYRQTAETGD